MVCKVFEVGVVWLGRGGCEDMKGGLWKCLGVQWLGSAVLLWFFWMKGSGFS